MGNINAALRAQDFLNTGIRVFENLCAADYHLWHANDNGPGEMTDQMRVRFERMTITVHDLWDKIYSPWKK